MAMFIGIDTGGTYTDAVLLDDKEGVIATAKSPTTTHDLAAGIRDSIAGLFEKKRPDIQLVSLSSTLATNAVVEGKGRPAGLILIGYDDDILQHEMFAPFREENKMILVNGGHLISGEEKHPLDKNKIRDAVASNRTNLSAFAVSGYFGVRNPAHELEAKSIIRRTTALPVTCGHELTSSLDAPKRALTTLLNARLIPLLSELIHSVKSVLDEFQIHAPLMIVKGDGSLVSSETALDVPVETILSGPAASLAGARYLTGEQDGFIIDMGGTTSDMAILRQGHPVVSENNPDIGGFHPMVDAVDMFTKGIGGDSFIRATPENSILAGPERVLPLCRLGHIHPEIIDRLKHSPDHKKAGGLPLFIYKKALNVRDTVIPAVCSKVLHLLEQGPLFVPDILNESKSPSTQEQSIGFLIKNNMVSAASFTPTDAVNVTGHYTIGSSGAASAGADVIAERLGMNAADLCKQIFGQMQKQLARAVIDCALRSEGTGKNNWRHPADAPLIEKAVQGSIENSSDRLLSCRIMLEYPVIALGAPSGTYLPGVASMLNASIIVPEYSEVANAIGAVTGTISQKSLAVIKQVPGGNTYRVHAGGNVRDFQNHDAAEAYAVRIIKEDAAEKAVSAGAGTVEVKINKTTCQHGHWLPEDEHTTIIETQITATAVGRPRMREYGGHDA